MMKFWRRGSGRYVARSLDWRPLMGVETGVVDDTTPGVPSVIDKRGPGWEHITTLTNARRIARRANRVE